jgi:hypothetical protein
LTTFTDFTVKRARPQLSVYTTDYWILPNPYVFSNNLYEATTKFLTIYFYIKNITNFVCLNESDRKFTAKAKLKQIE